MCFCKQTVAGKGALLQPRAKRGKSLGKLKRNCFGTLQSTDMVKHNRTSADQTDPLFPQKQALEAQHLQ